MMNWYWNFRNPLIKRLIFNRQLTDIYIEYIGPKDNYWLYNGINIILKNCTQDLCKIKAYELIKNKEE